MASRIDATGELLGLDETASLTLARLCARALEGGSLAGIDELERDECADALEALGWPSADSLERLAMWLGADHAPAAGRARRLRGVLEAAGTLAVCADPAQTAPVMGALQRLSLSLIHI